MGEIMALLRRLETARAEVEEARLREDRLAGDLASLTAHADALERALETLAEAVGDAWEDDTVGENLARVLRAIERLKRAET